MGINRDRIIENNLKLSRLKVQTEELPEYQDMHNIYSAIDYEGSSTGVQTYSSSSYGGDKVSILGDYILIVHRYWYDTGMHMGVACYIKKINDDGTLTSLWSYSGSEATESKYDGAIVDYDDDYLYFVAMSGYNSVYSTTRFTLRRLNLSTKAVEDYMTIDTSALWFGTNALKTVKRGVLFFYSRIFTFNVQNKTYSSLPAYGNNSETIGLTKEVFTNSGRTYLYNYKMQLERALSNVNWVSRLNDKVLVGNELYYLNSNLTLGSKIKSNCIPSLASNSVFIYLDGEYYINRVNGDLYTFDDNTNTFTYIASYKNGTGIIFTPDFNWYYTDNLRNVYVLHFKNYSKLVGYKVKGTDFYLNKDFGQQNNRILNNTTVFDSSGNVITGTMSNNENLNYTPTTSQQIIPSGYTSGGTIAGVTAAIDSNITQANVKVGTTILGITGTFTSDGDAVASEIAEGKIAYVNGEKIVGTFSYEEAGTLSPQEYEEAMGTADDILGIEPEPEIQDHYEIEYD